MNKMEFEPFFLHASSIPWRPSQFALIKNAEEIKGVIKFHSVLRYYIHIYVCVCVVLCILYNFGTICCGVDFVVVKMVSFNRDCNIRILHLKSSTCHWPCDEQFPLPKPSFSLLQREDNETDLLYKVLWDLLMKSTEEEQENFNYLM